MKRTAVTLTLLFALPAFGQSSAPLMRAPVKAVPQVERKAAPPPQSGAVRLPSRTQQVTLRATTGLSKTRIPPGTSVSSRLGEIQAKPAGSAAINEQDGWVCTSQTYKATLANENFMNVAGPTFTASLFPGAMYAYGDFMGGNPVLQFPSRNPAPITVTVNGVKGSPNRPLQEFTFDEVQDAINDITRTMTPSNKESFTADIYQMNSAAEQEMKLSAGGAYYGATINTFYDNKSKKQSRYYVVDAVQRMYVAKVAQQRDGILTPDANIDANSSDLMMMDSVTYGHRIMLTIKQEVSSSEQAGGLDAKFSNPVVKANVGLSAFQKNLNESSEIKAYVVGGSTVTELPNGSNIEAWVKAQLAGMTAENARPIEYHFVDMANRAVRTMSTTDIPTRTCMPKPKDPNAQQYDVRVTLTSIAATSRDSKDVQNGYGFGGRINVRAFSKGGARAFNEVNGQPARLACWLQDREPGCDGKLSLMPANGFYNSTQVNRTRTFRMSFADIQAGAYIDLSQDGDFSIYRSSTEHMPASAQYIILKEAANPDSFEYNADYNYGKGTVRLTYKIDVKPTN